MAPMTRTPYVLKLNELLRPASPRHPLVLDLFAGCGGLALGFEAMGFETDGFEIDADCCATYRKNLQGPCDQVFLTRETELPDADVVIGGPPCQPFSVGGRQTGIEDIRDGFPAFISAIDRLRPKLWMFENVRGLFYRNKGYFTDILRQLAEFGYVVNCTLVNAVAYGVPQNRERVIVVGHRGGFKFPHPSRDRVTVGMVIGESALSAPPESKFLTASMDAYVARYEKASQCRTPRDLHLEKPARTLTCRNLAGATGDMQRIRLPDGRRRRLLVDEAARLQTFPDWFSFEGGETSQYTQIGNAVAPLLARHLAAAVRDYLDTYTDEPTMILPRPSAEQLTLV